MRVLRLIALSWLSVVYNAASQEFSTNPLATRLTGDWKLERVQTLDGMQHQSPVIEFRMLVAQHGTLSQGLYPEGMFASTWRFDVLNMTLYVTDVESAATYPLRVLQLTRDALVLEPLNEPNRTVMYYVALR